MPNRYTFLLILSFNPAIRERSLTLRWLARSLTTCVSYHFGTFALRHTKTTTHHHPPTAAMSDSDSSGLSSAPEEEVKKLAPIFQKAKKATKKAAPPPKASPPRPKRAPSPPHEETFADNPDIAVSWRPGKREMARL